MDISEDNVQMLLSMGFPNESEVRRALRQGKDDISEAVAILTNESRNPDFDILPDSNVEMKEPRSEIGSQTSIIPYGPYQMAPVYDDSSETTSQQATDNSNQESAALDDSDSLEFPVPNLIELEGRVFVEMWSIPYRRDESLARCLISTTRLVEAGLVDTSTDCKRFLDRCLPESCKKLLTSAAVNRWGPDIQRGVCDMLELFIDLMAMMLSKEMCHIPLLEMLAEAFNGNCEFHMKNRIKECDRSTWNEKFGCTHWFTESVLSPTRDGTYGWLLDLINRFGDKKGFHSVRELFNKPNQDAPTMAALLAPFGMCAEWLNSGTVSPLLAPCVKIALQFVKGLSENEFKDKRIGSVCDLLATIKLLRLSLWPEELVGTDELRLEVVLRMLKSIHYNARMNALKEITRLLEETTSPKLSRSFIRRDELMDWLLKKKVLSIALEGNIDHMQYCEKVKTIVDFLGVELTLDELTKLWAMQRGQRNVVIDNIHSILVAAAIKFNVEQLEHLFSLIQESWSTENDRNREKLLALIGKIGRESRSQRTTTRTLELLWEQAHVEEISTQLMEQALEEHLSILSNSNMFTTKDQLKKTYVFKCVDDIREGRWVLPALRHLLDIAKNIAKQGFNKSDRGILQELHKNHDIIRQVTASLTTFHEAALLNAEDQGLSLSEQTLVDHRYSHKEYVNVHLGFLQFLLKEGSLYLPIVRAREIWSTLIASTKSCAWEKQVAFEWFSKCLPDLEDDTQMQLFQKEFLRLDPSKLSVAGFACFKHFFENVNMTENKLKKTNAILTVEKLDLIGFDYVWEICMNTQDHEISESAITLLLNMSYMYLSGRLKKDAATLHKKFIEECYKRLEAANVSLSGSVVSQTLLSAVKIVTAVVLPDPTSQPTAAKSPTHLLNIERLLLIAERYILLVEEQHPSPRTILPHGMSFHGRPMTLQCNVDSPKMDFSIKAHSNETFASVRSRIANKVKCGVDNVQVFYQERLLCRDQKTLHQLDLEDNATLTVRGHGTPVLSSPSQTTVSVASSTKQSFDIEQEKMLPGVLMSSGGNVFEMLYQLTDLDNVRVTSRARSLLSLVPTDPQVLEQLDSLGQKVPKSEEISPRASPRASPRKYILGHTPPLQLPKTITKDVIRAMFDAQASGMSSFRVLYNLEVLSSRLMPVSKDAALSGQSSGTFCNEFVSSGGLGVLVNLLQKEGLPADIDSATRQDCYAICLQLLKFLLCGDELVGDSDSAPVGFLSNGPTSLSSAGASFLSLTAIDTSTSSKQNKILHSMNSNDLNDLLGCLVRVSWAAAAGHLQMACAQSVNEYVTVTASRTNSTSSTTSTGSEGDNQWLHLGVCVRQKNISAKDVTIAVDSFELLITCLRLRPALLPLFYNFPYLSDFIIDVLVGCTSEDVRSAAVRLLQDLCRVDVMSIDTEKPLYFLLKLLLSARLPFWVSSSIIRGTNHRLLRHCPQYFELRCHLTQSLSILDQQTLGLDLASMLEDEIAWLTNFVPSDHKQSIEVDNRLIAGHLDLVRTGLTCEGVDKVEIGRCLVKELLHEFLFPSCSYTEMAAGDRNSAHEVIKTGKPKCSNSVARVAAYRVLVELVDGCTENMTLACNELVSLHHTFNAELAKEWEYMPPVEGRSSSGFVGLRNGGATCYMNAVLQQIHMAPGVSEALLAIDDERVEEDSVFHQLQQILGHLTDSQLQYYSPEKFWKVFKLWGESINIHEQQDALDFFQALIDQVDEHLKKLGRESVFKRKFQGVFSDQKICQDCPHRYEREEIFYALNVTVKNANLQDSLDQFVKGELLDGDNAYFCEKCGQKRNAVKRMCIKTLPPILCIQLKRFDYDWEANKALKFDDYFKFPMSLDMEPYTSDGLESRDSQCQPTAAENAAGGGDEKNGGLVIVPVTSSRIVYDLVGVVVHSGQANAGHYYSFIKERRDNYLTNTNFGKWYKFNDTFVEEFEMNELTIESECFGGKYKAKAYDNSSSSYPEERIRYWNGYLLFYEKKVEEIRTPSSGKKTKIVIKRHQADRFSLTKRSSDSFVELTELVHKGDQRGLFSDKMPARIQREIRENNQRFLRNSGVYNTDYFRFIRELTRVNASQVTHPSYNEITVQGIALATRFLFNTYMKTKRKLRDDLEEWVVLVENLLQKCKAASNWLVDYLANDGRMYIKLFILECPIDEIRGAFSRIFEKLIVSYFQHGGMPTHKNFNELMELVLNLLSREVVENIRNASTYFQILYTYVLLGTKACTHMFGLRAFPRLAMFLLGARSMNGASPDRETSPALISQRRWSSVQARDFGLLHAVMANLVLNCDVSSRRTEGDKSTSFKPRTVTPTLLLRMPLEIVEYVFGQEANNYIREAVMSLREVDSHIVHASVHDLLLYCSFNNALFSNLVIKNIMIQYTSAPSNELKNILSMLQELLLLEDALQTKRLQCVIDGYMDENNTSFEGLLSTIRQCHLTDSRRSYQCIKFLVNLSAKCVAVKEYLLASTTKWQWAVNWLKKKMNELYMTNAATQASNDDSNSKFFQRTMSAQSTLDDATALLNEMENHEEVAEVVGSAIGSEGSSHLSEASSNSSIASTLTAVDQVDMELDDIDTQSPSNVSFTTDSSPQAMDILPAPSSERL